MMEHSGIDGDRRYVHYLESAMHPTKAIFRELITAMFLLLYQVGKVLQDAHFLGNYPEGRHAQIEKKEAV